MRFRKAFTLLEILIATGILGGALVALLSSINHSVRMERRSVRLLQQSIVARNKMTEVLALRELDEHDHDEGVFDDAPGFRWRYEVDEFTLPFYEGAIVDKKSDLLRVTVEVVDSSLQTPPLRLCEYRRKGSTL